MRTLAVLLLVRLALLLDNFSCCRGRPRRHSPDSPHVIADCEARDRQASGPSPDHCRLHRGWWASPTEALCAVLTKGRLVTRADFLSPSM